MSTPAIPSIRKCLGTSLLGVLAGPDHLSHIQTEAIKLETQKKGKRMWANLSKLLYMTHAALAEVGVEYMPHATLAEVGVEYMTHATLAEVGVEPQLLNPSYTVTGDVSNLPLGLSSMAQSDINEIDRLCERLEEYAPPQNDTATAHNITCRDNENGAVVIFACQGMEGGKYTALDRYVDGVLQNPLTATSSQIKEELDRGELCCQREFRLADVGRDILSVKRKTGALCLAVVAAGLWLICVGSSVLW